jgi:hypothetical protein
VSHRVRRVERQDAAHIAASFGVEDFTIQCADRLNFFGGIRPEHGERLERGAGSGDKRQ